MMKHSLPGPQKNERWGKNKDKQTQGVPQSQAVALPRHQEETDKTKQAQIEQTYEKQ